MTVNAMYKGVFVNARGIRITIHMRQQGNLSSSCWFKLVESDQGKLTVDILKYSITWKKVSWCNTIPCAQGGVLTLKLFSKYEPPLPWRWVLERGRLPVLSTRSRGRIWCDLSHTDSTKVT